MKKIYLPLSAMILSLGSMAQQTFTNFMNASLVIGQANFTTNSSTTNQSTNYGTTSSVISPNGKLACGSQSARRILIWNQVPTANGAPADFVIGQPNFTAMNSGCTQSQMGAVEGIAFSPDGTKMIAADATNNRVLIWNTIPTSNFQPADVVIGQTSFTSNISGIAADKLNYPSGVIVTPDGKLIVSDMYNYRVLIYNSIPTTNGASADVVIGQTNFTTNSSGTGNNKFNMPWYLTLSQDGKLLVADHANSRVMVFNTVPTVNGASANVVIGQPDFVTTSSGTAQNKFNYPIGVTAAPDGKIAISEFSNNRVVIYNTIPTSNGANADVVLGQPGFVTSTAFNGGITAQSMQAPYGIWFDVNSRLFVNGRDMNRVMVFGSVPTSSADVSVNMQTNSSNLCQTSPVQYTITINNNGPSTASNVVVNTALPNQFTLSTSNASAGTYTTASGWWQIPSINSGSSAILVLTGNVNISANQTLTAYANITNVNAFDTNLSNNGTGSTVVVTNNTPPSNVTISGPSTVCASNSYSFSVATSSNATNFSWSANNNAIVTGSGTLVTVLFSNSNSNILVTPSNSFCTGPVVAQNVTVNPSPTVAISSSNSVICNGSSAILTAGGADTYTWNTSSNSASISVTPSATINYTVTGTNSLTGCSNSSVASITVNPLPNLTVNSTSSVLCIGSSAVLTAGGASTYTWNTTATTATISVSPSVTTTYTVTGTNANNCSNTSTFTQQVANCTALNEINMTSGISVYPNPSSGMIQLNSNENISACFINDITGKNILTFTNLNANNVSIDLNQLNASVYIIKAVLQSGEVKQARIVIQK
jgi:hypothetical protein